MYAESLRHYLKPVIEYLDDPAVTEVMINGPEDIWIEKKGRVIKTNAKFTVEGIEAAARNMAQYVGRMLDDERPRLDARLPDGSRIHVVMPPIARLGCTIAIRKFFPDKLTVDKLVEFGSMTPAMARFINACVEVKENIIVSGGTGSGKTTLLNCVAQYIPDDERILTIEDSAELQLNQEHLVPFESRPPDKFGKGKVDMGDLLHSALRLRPDRIVVGEVRGGEAFHLMQAMNTGHGGSLATVHANTPTDTLRRLESLCLQSGIELPMVAVRAQVASAINIVIVCDRLQDGQRKTTHISEVLPLNEKGDYRTQDLFVFTPTHKDSEGRVHGYHAPTGLLPTFLDRLAAYGFADVDDSFFDPATYDVDPPPIFTASEGYKARWAPSLAHREHGEKDPQRRPSAPQRPSSNPSKEAKKPASGSPKKRGGIESPDISARSKTPDEAKKDKVVKPGSSLGGRTRKAEEEASAALDEMAPIESLGVASLDAESAEDDESTDPSLVGLEPEGAEELRSAKDETIDPLASSDPIPSKEPDLEEIDSEHILDMPTDAGQADLGEEILSADDELAAIEAAIAAEAAAPAQDDKEFDPNEPSIQLSTELEAEAVSHEETPFSKKGLSSRSRGSESREPGRRRPAAGRRRKGGVVGRPGDPD